MKASDVYLRAAEFMDRPERMAGCCYAISQVTDGGSYKSDAHQKFEKYFNWMAGVDSWLPYPMDKDVRVLALCLMSAISADEERSE